METLSFVDCVAKVINAQPSGTYSSDVIHLATALYNKLHSVNQRRLRPYFQVFVLLVGAQRSSEVWHYSSFPDNATITTNVDNNGDVPIPIENVESFKYPVSRKRAKLEDGKTKLAAKKVKIAKETLEAQKESSNLMRSQQKLSLVTLLFDSSDPLVK